MPHTSAIATGVATIGSMNRTRSSAPPGIRWRKSTAMAVPSASSAGIVRRARYAVRPTAPQNRSSRQSISA